MPNRDPRREPDSDSDVVPSVTTTVDIERSTDDVWEALVDCDGLSRWLGADSEIEPWPGGEVTTPDVVTGEPKRGRVADIVPGRSIELDWWPVGDPDRTSRVSVVLTPIVRGTRVTVTETQASACAAAVAWRAALLSVTSAVAVGGGEAVR